MSYEEDKKTASKAPATGKGKKAAGPVKKQASKLDPRVQDLIKLICDVEIFNKTLSEIGYDAKKMPLGKLSSETLK
jgi:poly [ADP-ribose] polymerase